MPRLLHAHYHVMLRVQKGRNQLQAVALQHLDVQRHTLGVALHCPHLHILTNSAVCSQHAPKSCLLLRLHTCSEPFFVAQMHQHSYSVPAPAHMKQKNHHPHEPKQLFIPHTCTHAPQQLFTAHTCTHSHIQRFIANMRSKAVYSPRLQTCTKTALHGQHASQQLHSAHLNTHQHSHCPHEPK